MKPAGFNPLRYDCTVSGCFNKKRRPKIEVFADCFPRRINFGDVDGLVELNGSFVLLEWKGAGGVLRDGQRRSLQAFSRQRANLAIVVEGDAESMTVSRLCFFWHSRLFGWRVANLSSIKEIIRRWVAHQERERMETLHPPETWSGLSLPDARANAEGCYADAIAALRKESERG